VFGQHNDPLGFQPRWRERLPRARQLEIPGGNHFPMCDDPRLLADGIDATFG
jgi:haloalkane dehalogenase